MPYSGVLPQAIKGNKLIQQGVRMPKSVPQIPFKGAVAPKIERAGVVKRLSPSMSKQRTFTSRSKFNFMDEGANFQYPYPPAPYYPPPGYPTPQPQMQPMPPPPQPRAVQGYPYAYPSPYNPMPSPRPLTVAEAEQMAEPRRRVAETRATYNSGVNTSKEVRNWLSTINSSNREVRSNLRFLRDVYGAGGVE